MTEFRCQTRIVQAGKWSIARIPKETSKCLSSRGMLIIAGTINSINFQTALEPDGEGGHWFRIDDEIIRTGSLKLGDEIELAFMQSSVWPEPDLPSELLERFIRDPHYQELWSSVSVKARWEWIRWIRSAKSEFTRQKRIAITLDKLNSGHKRPCCFNNASCSIPDLSRAGILRVNPD